MENNTPAKKQLPAFVILGIISLVAALVLAATNAITEGPIQEIAMKALRDSFSAVMPADSYEEITVPADYDVRSLYVAKNGDEVIGWCVTAAGMGYNGEVAVTLGVGTDGLVTGCAVGDTSFAETPGFGARAKEASFQDQFVGLDAVNGGSFEALTGATVTSNAILEAVNKALLCVDEVAMEKAPATTPLVAFGAPAEKPAATPAAPLTGDVREGTARGFQSDVNVQVSLDASGAVTGLIIDSSNETEGFGTRCAEDAAFIEQFVGKTGPFTLGDGIDALSGATVTSTAVVDEVNAALSAPASAVPALSATAKGFQSDVTVTLTVTDGAIDSIVIDSAAETEGFGTRCAADEAFLAQFIGKSAPLTLGENIDALSGATVTSTAVVDAANAALASAASAPAAEVVTPITSNDDAELGVKDNGAAVVDPADGYTGTLNVSLNVEDGKVTSGEFVEEVVEGQLTATAKGFQSDVTVKVTLNEDGTIATLVIDSAAETTGFGTRCGEDEAFAAQFIGKAAPFTAGEGVDVLSGATVTSNAVIAALNSLAGEETPAVDATSAATDATSGATAAEDQPAAEETPAAEELTATAKGYQSDVTVKVTLNEDGTIATLTIESAGETQGLGTRCGEDEAFAAQFIGKAAPFTAGEGVDVLSGATVTSNAVMEALNSAVQSK